MPNLRVALRTLTKTPFVTMVAIASLALGIGANAAIFSLFDQMLLRALPVQEPERLVNLAAPGPKPGSQSCNQAGDCDAVFSYPMFRDLEAAETGLAGIAAHVGFGANLARDGETISAQGMLVSGSYFPLLGLRPALGRLLGPADDRVIGEHFVAVLSHGYWQDHLGSDPSVLNGTIVVNGRSLTIVGVAPAGFEGTTLGSRPDVFVPITMRTAMSPWFEGFENRRSYWAYLFGRLAPGVALEQADGQINNVYAAIINEVEAPLQEGMSEATLTRFRAKRVAVQEGQRGQSSLHGEVRTPLLMLFTVTGVVLLIACANIANLLLVRAAARGPEMAIRGSLGAPRRQLVGQLLCEALLLALAGGAASVVVGRATLGLIASILPPNAAATFTPRLDPGAIVFIGALAIATGVLFGLAPALHATRSDLVTTLRASAGQTSGAGSAARFRSALVVGQLGLSMALLVAAGLFIKSLWNIARVDLGLEPRNVVTFRISPELNGYQPAESWALFEGVEEGLAAIPGVSSVSAAAIPVLRGWNSANDVSVEGFESGPDVNANSSVNWIGPGYFSTLGIPLLAGREFTPADGADAPLVAIVNEAFAAKFGLAGPRAVGKRMARARRGDELDIEIVGVVRDARYSEVKQEVPPQFFTPYRQDPDLGSIAFYARTGGEPDPVLRAIPGMIARLDPNLPVEDLKTLEAQVRENVFLDRVIGQLSTSFAVLATLLAAVGLYGVLAYTVAQRTREIGLRMALGADRRRVQAMVLRQVGKMTALGGALGVVAALALGRAADSLLYEMGGNDPVVLLVVVPMMAAVALAAGLLPALRASRVDPMKALRYE